MKLLPTALTRTVGNQKLLTQKNAPTMLFAGGIIGVIGGTVLACRATLKAQDTVKDLKEGVEVAKNRRDVSFPEGSEDLPDPSYGSDLTQVYATAALDLVKLYGPAIIIGGAGIAALTASHKTLTSRNASLTAAYAVVTEALESYRSRVREEVGEDREKDLFLGRTIQEAINPETKEVEEFYSVDPNDLSPYARIFDESSREFQKQAELNRLFIQCQQNYANQLLHARGHVFLNEVYDSLGFDRSSAGAVVGWVLSDEGDNYIDFHMFDARNSHFINAWEPRVILDFNVDGVIFDKIGRKK